MLIGVSAREQTVGDVRKLLHTEKGQTQCEALSVVCVYAHTFYFLPRENHHQRLVPCPFDSFFQFVVYLTYRFLEKPAVVAAQVHETFDFVMGRAVTALPKFVGFINKNLKRNPPSSSPAARAKLAGTETAGGNSSGDGSVGGEGGGSRGGDGVRLKRGLLYMRGEVSAEELAELGAQPSTVIPLQRDFVRSHGGEEGPEGGEGGTRDRGYSSVFHFTSESIWNRMPVAASSSAGERD